MISTEARRDKQVLFFSATWPPSVERAALRLCSRGGGRPRRVGLEPLEVEGRDDGRSLPPSVIQQVVEVVRRDDHDTWPCLDFLTGHVGRYVGKIVEDSGKGWEKWSRA